MLCGMNTGVSPYRLMEEANKIVRYRTYKEDDEIMVDLYDMELFVKYKKGVLTLKGVKKNG
jgi:hypothetical protein